jgi:geranylgeranyl pyrophosphate synthase
MPRLAMQQVFWLATFLYSRAFQMMVDVENMRVMRVLSDATNVIAEGEVLQLMNCHDADVDEARYMQVIHYKTAKLFEAAAQLGGIVGLAEPAMEAALGVLRHASWHGISVGRRCARLLRAGSQYWQAYRR